MGSQSQSHYSHRSRGSSSRRAAEPDPHHNLKTSLQVVGLLICLRLLLPKMFPSEHEPATQSPPPPRHNYHRNQRYGYDRTDMPPAPPPPYSRAQIQGPSEMGEMRRIEPAYPASSAAANANADRERYRDRGGDVDEMSLDGTTAYGSDDGDSEREYERERAARRRERRREREQDRDRERRRRGRNEGFQ